MGKYFFSYPGYNISLTCPKEVLGTFLSFYPFSQRKTKIFPLHSQYEIKKGSENWQIYKDGEKCGVSNQIQESFFIFKEEIQAGILKSAHHFPVFHAGAVEINKRACLIPGKAEAGKTTTTFQLVELGCKFLCEEIAVLDPEDLTVRSFPQAMSMEKSFFKEYSRHHTIKKGNTIPLTPAISIYSPLTVGGKKTPLDRILIPQYFPQQKSEISTLTPAEALPEILGYCFPPAMDDEALFDQVIKILERVQVIRLVSNSIEDRGKLLKSLLK